MIILQAMLFILIAVVGAAVALTRNTTNQIIVAGIYGLLLALLFFTLHAPDVSLAAIVVGAVGLPMMVLVALGRLKASP